MERIIKVHEDVLTAHVIIEQLMKEYIKNGFSVEKTSIISFKLIFPDGWVNIYWDKGRVYEEVFENAIA